MPKWGWISLSHLTGFPKTSSEKVFQSLLTILKTFSGVHER
jgi:hypothetical protein